jgi:hypothetical protein
MSFCPNLKYEINKKWIEKVGESELYRARAAYGGETPSFGPFTTVEETENFFIDHNRVSFADRRHNDKIYIKSDKDRAVEARNTNNAKSLLEKINKVYPGLLTYKEEPIEKTSFNNGRTKAGYIQVNQNALDRIYKPINQVQEQRNSEQSNIQPTQFTYQKNILLKTFKSWLTEDDIIEDNTLTSLGQLEFNSESKKYQIKVNPDLMTEDTLGHEFGHLLIDLIGGLNNPLIKSAREQLKGTDIEKRVFAKYPDLVQAKDDRIDKEVLAQAIGEETVKIFGSEQSQSKWNNFLIRFFNRVKSLLGIDKNAVRQLANTMIRGEVNTSNSISSEAIQEQRKDIKDVEDLKNSIIESLTNKITIYNNRSKAKDRVNKLKEKLEAIKKAKGAIGALMFLQVAQNQTNSIFNNAMNLRNREKAGEKDLFSLKELSTWKDYLESFSLLREFRDMLIKDPELFNKELNLNPQLKEEKELLDLQKDLVTNLNNVLTKKETVESIYNEKGQELLTKSLVENSTLIEAQFRENAEKVYMKMSPEVKKDITLQQYIDQDISKNRDEINTLTHNLITKELSKAATDVGQMTRWLESLQDTPDPVVAAMIKKYTIADRTARLEAEHHRRKTLDLLQGLEEKFGKGLKDQRKLYDWMLEKDSKGNYTQHLITEHNSEMMEEYHSKIKEWDSDPKLNFNQVSRLKTEWKQNNMPLNVTEFDKAKQTKLQQLLKEGLITQKEYNDVEYNNNVYYRDRQSLDKLIANHDAIDDYQEWIEDNINRFREPVTKWINPQWKELQKILKDENDPRTKFYNHIIKTKTDVQKMLPGKFSLDTRLPGITKDNMERLASGQSAKDVFKGAVNRELSLLADDTDKGQFELTNESGQQVNFLPIFYTHKIEEKDQSYDIASMYTKYYEMATDYTEKSQILPEMEMTRELLNTRKVIKRDSSGNPILKRLFDKSEKESEIEGSESNIAKQYADWMNMVVYGHKEKLIKPINIFGIKVDVQKAARTLGKYTSLNLLGGNYVAGIANIAMGETMQQIEVMAGQHVTLASYAKASNEYLKNLPEMLNDVTMRMPNNIINLLSEKFDNLNEGTHVDFKTNTKVGHLFSTNTLFFTMHGGEHLMQNRMMLAFLMDKRAYNSKGEDIGNMYDQYKAEKGHLKLSSEVDLEKSNWIPTEQILFGEKLKRVLAAMHGEYSEIGRLGIQQYAIGNLALMYRKFVVPGIKRRYGKKRYNELLGDYTEGSYRYTAGFFREIWKDLAKLQFALVGEKWDNLTAREKANVKRTLAETSALITACILAAVLNSLRANATAEGDDDTAKFYALFAYQMYRLRTELLFFTPKLDESMKILKSPMASTSVLESLIKISGQVFNPFQEYQRGYWKGDPKLLKYMMDMVPVIKQTYRLSEIQSETNWFK